MTLATSPALNRPLRDWREAWLSRLAAELRQMMEARNG